MKDADRIAEGEAGIGEARPAGPWWGRLARRVRDRIGREARGLTDPASRRRATEQDVTNLYHLLFGRAPESGRAVVAKSGQPRLGLIRQILGSPEFTARVIEPVSDGRRIGGLLFDRPPPDDLLAWAAEFLPLSGAGRQALPRARDWPAAFAVLFGDAEFTAASAPATADPAFLTRLRAQIDKLGGRMVVGAVEAFEPTRVRGWAFDRTTLDAPLAVQLYADGVFLAAGIADQFRADLLDVQGGEGRVGFEIEGFAPPHPNSERSIALEVREAASQIVLGRGALAWHARGEASYLARLSQELALARTALDRIERAVSAVGGGFGFTLERYDEYRRVHYARSAAERREEARRAERFTFRPRLSLVLPIDETAYELEGLLDDLAGQSHPDWEMTIVGEGERAARATGLAAGARRRLGDRVRTATNDGGALDGAGEVLVLLDGALRLAPDALFQLALAFQADPRPALVYGDEDHLAWTGGGWRHLRPVFRTAFDYDLLLQDDGVGTLLALERPLLTSLVDAGARLAPGSRRDLTLRAAERLEPGRIAHVSRVLAHRQVEAKPSTDDITAGATRDHLARIGSTAEVDAGADPLGGARPGAVRVRWPLGPDIRAAVIIPTRDRLDLLQPCLNSLIALQADNRVPLEIVVIDNDSRAPATLAFLRSMREAGRLTVLDWSAPFNWAAINNHAAAQLDADVLIFLNNDTVALTRDWSDELCRQAMRPEVGAVGARLLYADGTIQHAGMVAGGVNSLITHEAAGAPGDDPGYLGRNVRVRNVSAVTGACLATRAQVFRELGGFDAEGFAIEANDVDYCLRVRRAGLAVLYDPHCTLHHFESKSRGPTDADPDRRAQANEALDRLRRRWGPELADDPFYNRHFDRYSRPFSRLQAPDAFG